MPRTRTTKKLAQRIDLDYFKRPSWLRRWKLLLSIGVPVAALIWLAWYGVRRNERIYSAGNLSEAHAVLSGKCEACHATGFWYARGKVSDQKCQACHDGSIHQATQVFTPACSSCHVEHQGAVRIAATSDAACTQCHANLQARAAPIQYVRSIHSFNGDHPEFAALREGRANPANIQLNHYLHMRANLVGPGGRVQMTCNDCHRSAAGVSRPWRFADPNPQASAVSDANAAKADPFAAAPARAYMLPPTFVQTCASCHNLQFDKQLSDAVPHDKPEVIHPFIVSKLQAYIAAHPADLRVPVEPDRSLPQKTVATQYRLLTPTEWVAERTAQDEQLLWRKTCKQCHTIIPGAEAAQPKIAPSNLAVRYMPHAKFDHSQHGLIECTGCHAGAALSQQTSDLLLPGIATCRACHHSGAEAAEARCFECHTYHDPLRHQPAHSNFSLPDLVSKADLRTSMP